MNARPLNDRVLLRRVDTEKKKGVLHIPDQFQEKRDECIVVAVGPGKMKDDGTGRLPMSVKALDHVLVGKYSGNEIKIDGVQHLVVREDDIAMVFVS